MVVHVCPEKDIECGSNPKRWCEKCPQWPEWKSRFHEPVLGFGTPSGPGINSAGGCHVCGVKGLHACLGASIPLATESQRERLMAVLEKYPPQDGIVAPQVTEIVNAVVAEHGLADTPIKFETSLVTTGVHVPQPQESRNWTDTGIHYQTDKSYSSLFLQAKAFLKIRDVINAEDQDGVLAKIRQIVKDAS